LCATEKNPLLEKKILDSVHPETGDFQMLSDLAPGSVRSDARQIHFSGALANQISTN
jgi:hypothetical protein